MDAGLGEIARFLALRAPFESLAPEELGDLAQQTEIEFHSAGAVILSEDGGPVTFLRVIHSGGVDITHDGRLLDLLSDGDTFGHAAMLSGLPPGFEARASEDTLCYRIPVAVARPLLDRARSRELAVGVHEPGHQAVAKLIRSPTVRCDPSTPIGETARRMTEVGANAAVIDLPAGELGILTDQDLRTRVVAAGVPSSAPVSEVMTTPVFAVTPDRLGGEVLFEMLERGIRHTPVVSENGQLVGVVEDADLFAVAPRSWFGARRAIARADGVPELAEIVRGLPVIIAELHASEVRSSEVSRVLSALIDAVTIRALELAGEVAPLPGDGIVWVAVGSHSRRELTPGSAIRGALVCSDAPPAAWLHAASEALSACGIAPDLVVRSPREWESCEPDDELALGVLADRRSLFGTPRETLPTIIESRRELLLDTLARWALEVTPPTGFDAEGVLESGGKRSERLDIRRGAVAPITMIARWVGAAAGMTGGSTPERLRVAAERGVISDADAGTLCDAFELAFELRLTHHMERLAAKREPDDLVEPALMSPLARDHLRDVFRAVTSVQRRLRA